MTWVALSLARAVVGAGSGKHMKELISRFSWNAIKFNGQVLTCMILIWLAVVGCTISSIGKQSFSVAQHRFWVAFVILVPIIGVLCYLPVCFDADKHPELFFWRRSK